MATIDELNALLANLPGYALLSDPMKNAALAGARIPDSFGVWPGQDGYENTYDVYFAAISLIGFLQAQPVIRQSSSEGTSIAVDAPDWSGLLIFYKGQSPIMRAQDSTVLGVVHLPEDYPHVVRTDMSGRWDGYGDLDTDVS